MSICKDKGCTRMIRLKADKTQPSIRVERVPGPASVLYKDAEGTKKAYTYVFPQVECSSGLCEDCYRAKGERR